MPVFMLTRFIVLHAYMTLLCQLSLVTVTPGNVKRALITGGSGFVGRHFTKSLCDQKWAVTIVDNMISESAMSLDQWPEHLKPSPSCDLTFYKMDCRSFFSSSLSEHHYDLFLHLAAVVGGRAKIEGSPVAVADDLAIDSAAFQWAINTDRKPQPRQMVYFSSSAAYPVKYQTSNSGILLNESMIDLDHDGVDIAKPDLTYGWAKLTGEYLAKLAHTHYQLNVSIYRPMSGYGEDQHAAYPFKSILNKVTLALETHSKDDSEPVVEIWSDAVRDFIYIGDIVTCVLQSVDHVNNAEAVNLGTGIGTSFSSLAQLMAQTLQSGSGNGKEAAAKKVKVKVLSNMPTGVMYRVGSVTREKHVGCSFDTSLEEGIKIAIRFAAASKKLQEKKEKASNAKQAAAAPRYSSMQCIAGSQAMSMAQLTVPRATIKFPVHDPEYRTCLMRNLCWVGGQFTYYLDPAIEKEETLHVFNPHSFKDGLVHLGAWTTGHLPIHVVKEAMPGHLPLEKNDVQLAFLDAHSNSYNYGHYLLDNVMPHFMAASVFGLSFRHSRQVFESSCKHFGTQPESMSHKTVPFNHSMGTFRTACLDNINNWWKFFFDHPPRFLESPYSTDMCFPRIMMGQSSTFGLKGIDLSRAMHARRFRDFVLERMKEITRVPPQEKVILVGMRLVGHGGDEALPTMCQDTKSALFSLINNNLTVATGYTVRCVINQGMGFEHEIQAVQSAKVLISSHGTISYMSLFARDHTQQIVLYEPGSQRFKEHNILQYLTHVNVMYYPWDLLKEGKMAVMLLQALKNVAIHEAEEKSSSSSSDSDGREEANGWPTTTEMAMMPLNGTFITARGVGVDDNKVFQMVDGYRREQAAAPAGMNVVSIHAYDMNRIPKESERRPIAATNKQQQSSNKRKKRRQRH